MESKNIQHEVLNLLQLIQELDSKFSKNYLIHVLKGNSQFTKTEHHLLPQFGSCSNWSISKLEMLFVFLFNKEYLSLKNHQKGIYEVSERGLNYQKKAKEFWIRDYELKPTKRYYYSAIKALKQERKLQAMEKGCPEYELCSNFQLEQLIINDFKSIEELSNHPIFIHWEGKVNWDKMLLILAKCKNDYYDIKKLNQYQNYKKIEELIQENKSISEIISELNIKKSTLVKYVESIYENENENENLKLWIYKNVNKTDLVKCIEYFTRTKNYKLKEAKEQLKMDYETIRLGRIYFRIQQITVAA